MISSNEFHQYISGSNNMNMELDNVLLDQLFMNDNKLVSEVAVSNASSILNNNKVDDDDTTSYVSSVSDASNVDFSLHNNYVLNRNNRNKKLKVENKAFCHIVSVKQVSYTHYNRKNTHDVWNIAFKIEFPGITDPITFEKDLNIDMYDKIKHLFT